MHPRSLFSLAEHLERLSKDGDPLEVLAGTVEFEQPLAICARTFRVALPIKEGRNVGGASSGYAVRGAHAPADVCWCHLHLLRDQCGGLRRAVPDLPRLVGAAGGAVNPRHRHARLP